MSYQSLVRSFECSKGLLLEVRREEPNKQLHTEKSHTGLDVEEPKRESNTRLAVVNYIPSCRVTLGLCNTILYVHVCLCLKAQQHAMAMPPEPRPLGECARSLIGCLRAGACCSFSCGEECSGGNADLWVVKACGDVRQALAKQLDSGDFLVWETSRLFHVWPWTAKQSSSILQKRWPSSKLPSTLQLIHLIAKWPSTSSVSQQRTQLTLSSENRRTWWGEQHYRYTKHHKADELMFKDYGIFIATWWPGSFARWPSS